MARNRKRAKERRDRRPQPVAGRSRVPATRSGGEANPAPLDHAAAPLDHAAPEVELAEAQLAVGRAEAAPDGEPLSDGQFEALEDAVELEADDYAAGGVGGSGTPPAGGGGGGGDGGVPSGPAAGGAAALPGPVAAPERRPGLWARLTGFLQGSWHELQRVQWPDRRQTMQATAVVIGFVIVAGVFLGVADTLASHLMTYIITGAKSVLSWVAIAVIVLSLAGWMLTDRDR
jgi:preprotein translocase subunit SecE